jgi:hypothetical protein
VGASQQKSALQRARVLARCCCAHLFDTLAALRQLCHIIPLTYLCTKQRAVLDFGQVNVGAAKTLCLELDNATAAAQVRACSRLLLS